MNVVMCSLLVIAAVFCAAADGKPSALTGTEINYKTVPDHRLSKRFINPSMTSGDFSKNYFSRIRVKRDSEEECEKLRLCKLHAQSQRNFIAAFELYFVNKENARLWDHRARSPAECDERYSCYE